MCAHGWTPCLAIAIVSILRAVQLKAPFSRICYPVGSFKVQRISYWHHNSPQDWLRIAPGLAPDLSKECGVSRIGSMAS